MTTVIRRSPTAGAARSVPAPSAPAAPESGEGVQAGPERWDLELALAAMNVVALLGFHRVFAGDGWIGPVFATALGVQLVCFLTRRWVRRPVVAALIDAASIATLTLWTVLPSTTAVGLPRLATWRAAQASLSGISDRMQAATVPVHPFTGYLLLATIGAGIVGLAGSWCVFRLERTLIATVPSFSAFVVCCCLGTRVGRSWTIALEAIAIPAFVLVERQGALSSAAWFGGRRSGATVSCVRAGLPGIGLALVVALAIVPSLTASDGHGPIGWRSSGSDSPRIVISPLVSLSTRLLQQSDTAVFRVRSSVPSYWRLTSLDYFDGSQWNARDTYQQIDEKLPGVTAPPRGTRQVVEHFRIQDLDSVWLPLAFDPEAVSGAGDVSYDARSGSLLTPKPSSNHLDYTVTSLQYLASLSARDLRSAPVLGRSSTLAPYLQLPASVSEAVRNLARRLVAGKKTEYARAYALQQFFYGPSFTYSLRPPTDGSGTAALDTFLFHTRTGYCQQFAGSFAVMARAVGLPTRLAIGFTTGKKTAGGYEVTDADAHTWPEVWFPRYGWIPFEPTKGAAGGSGFAIPGAGSYTGDTAAPHHTIGTHASTPAPTPTVTVPIAPVGPVGHGAGGLPHGHSHDATAPTGGSGTVAVARRGPPPAGGAAGTDRLILAAALLGGLVALVVSNRLGRWWRWSRRRRAAARPGAAPGPVVTVWEETVERLAWQGVRRRSAETSRQFAGRVAAQRRQAGLLPLGAHLYRLADLLAEADYAPVVGAAAPASAVGSGPVAEAEQRGRAIAAVVGRSRTGAERWRLWLDPRLAWAPRTTEPSTAVWSEVTA